MELNFNKYQGTGNDFIILDNRNGAFSQLTTGQINLLCDRRFGIGADGLMLLNTHGQYDFEMKYYNADGRESSMCGNGGRCLVKFARQMGMKKDLYRFIAIDGEHEAKINEAGIVCLKMKDIKGIGQHHGDFILDTGSPHYVKPVQDVMNYDVVKKGQMIRNSAPYAEKGINVNFVQQKSEHEIIVHTYERGVEDETLSCGTGVTASALVFYHNERGFNEVTVHTRGGKITVEYDRTDEDAFENIWLCGPAEKVYQGTIELKT